MHLTLFFTHDTSLKTWERTGMLEREVALYRKYLEKGHTVSFITYGRKDRKLFSSRLEGINICCNHLGLPLKIYTSLIPYLHGQTLKRTDIIKSNQTPGALAALRTARLFSKPMVARCGYMHSEFVSKEHGEKSPAAAKALALEQELFGNADAIEVTTPMMKDSIANRRPETAGKIHVIPNYVDTERFAPIATIVKDIDLLFIGRLNPQKNLPALLEALRGTGLKSVIIGTGPLEANLKAKAQGLNLDITWMGNLPNTELPGYINRAKLFILPSLYEGHPKTLIEAMAAGAAVIGADAPGIREIIGHRHNGILCGTDPESINKALVELSTNPELRAELGKNARSFALDNYSLDKIVVKELSLLTCMASWQ